MVANGVLVLNRNWMAIHVCSLQRALGLLVQDLAQVVTEEYETYNFDSWRELSVHMEEEGNRFVHSPSFRLAVPEVILLNRFHKAPPKTVKFNRRNIYLRDQMTCQYCGVKPPREKLTIDHVLPRSKGGKSEWENVVLACQDCNARKGNRLLGSQTSMKLVRQPSKPHWLSIIRHSLKGHNRPTWNKFVDMAYWNVDLKED